MHTVLSAATESTGSSLADSISSAAVGGNDPAREYCVLRIDDPRRRLLLIKYPDEVSRKGAKHAKVTDFDLLSRTDVRDLKKRRSLPSVEIRISPGVYSEPAERVVSLARGNSTRIDLFNQTFVG
jgi:hypothetical protein